ncbi:hypothetical protein [Nocardia gipuzkoensis]|uniref:hypothetical protein n=1 Tax=Nocardia gipuzkoensis TaxID=2749991 RepID=UPI00237E225C|nr:hypothetical protein [Nocardia gipuzkoensis]MDE1673780.1 hypothetical protein [Nocardia gipuzkoensis]
MTLIRIYVRSDGAELDVREEETVSLKSEPETARLARIMRRVLGKVERAYGFEVANSERTGMVTIPFELLGKLKYIELTPAADDTGDAETASEQTSSIYWFGGASTATQVINWVLSRGGTARYVDEGEHHWRRRADDDTDELIVIDTPHGVQRMDPGDTLIYAGKHGFRVDAAKTDPRLHAALMKLGREFGPLGVALVASRFTDLGVLLERLGPAPEQSPTAAPAPMPELPAPTGCRGSGAAWWRVGRLGRPDGASISPTEEYDRNDPDLPTLNIAVEPGEWPIPDARNLALAILAATEWKEEDDTGV